MNDPALGLAPPTEGEDNRILLISFVGCPPPTQGNTARMAALIQELRRSGYLVHFAGIGLAEREIAGTQPMVDQWVGNFKQQPTPPLSAWGLLKRKARSLLHRLEWVEDRLDGKFCEPWLDEARDLQRRLQYRRVLVAYVHYSKFLLAFPGPCLRILDTHDVFSNRRQRLQAEGVTRYWRSYSAKDERRGLLRAQHILAIQEQEAAYFRRLLGPTAQVYTVGHLAEAADRPPPPAPFHRLGCIGSGNAYNVHGWQWFIGEVWPRIQQRMPGVEVWLAGVLCEKCAPAPGVRLLGQIPSLTDFYAECPVFINPVRTGTGLKIKTVEALMQGRPVVTTNVGAEGLESFRGHGLYVGDSAEEFAQAVVVLLSNFSQAQQAGEAARQRVQIYTAENQRALAKALALN